MNKENISAPDRELFSELIESQINLLLIKIVSLYVDFCDPKFHLQIRLTSSKAPLVLVTN